MRLAFPAAFLAFLSPLVVGQDGIPPLPDGVSLQTRESGLKWAELKAGDGSASPVLGDKVSVYYQGWLADGTVFDQRPNDGPPADFTCGGLIAGWNEALQQMSPGSRWRIECPPDLAYGERGSPPRIPAGATLTFELELVAVGKAPKFVPLDPDAAEKTESGIRYQVLAAGDGAKASPDRVFKLSYGIWDKNGRMLDSSFSTGRTIDGRCEDMRLPLLQEIPLLLNVGGSCLVEVTKEQSFQDGFPPAWGELEDGVTIWRLELREVLEPLPMPAFAAPAEDKSVTLDNGLIYQVLREGAGESPSPTDLVECHYAGWLTDGTLFDASYPRGEPLQIRGVQVIRGWTEALKRMKPGAIWVIQVPSELGYGPGGSPPVIPGGATLIFQLELVGVVGGR